MKFSLISDMHVDFPQHKTPYDLLEEVVVVAGDTSNGLEGLKFLNKMRNKGHKVFAVDGNHEHYRNLSQNRTEKETTARFREDNPRYCDDINDSGIPIVMANGWYEVADEELWYDYMNDGRMAKLSGPEVTQLAIDEASSIEERLKEWRDHQRKGIVVTHTAPCMETLNPRFRGHYSDDWYWNKNMYPLLAEYSDQILVWCHGHTHVANEAVVNGVRVVCNPRGYPGENPNWKPLTIEV